MKRIHYDATDKWLKVKDAMFNKLSPLGAKGTK
jgi:hypothetical protein